MSVISEFAAKQKSFNDRIDAAIAGITTDIKALNEEIKKFQASPGPITPKDQALLDGLEARVAGITAKLEAIDALRPPVPPAA